MKWGVITVRLPHLTDGHQGVRPVGVEHRHGPDKVPRRVLRLCGAWRKHEHGNHRHYCYMYLVHFHGLL